MLPQTHSPEVDYSLFIMETVEKSMEKMETTPAAPRRSFPPPICSSRSLFRGFVFLRRSLPKAVEGLFLLSFLDQGEGTKMKTDDIGATRGKRGALTRPGNLAAWDPPKSSSDFLSCTFLAPTLCSFQKMIPAKY